MTGSPVSKVFAYLNEQDGFSAAEYAMAAALMGAAIALFTGVLTGVLGGSAGAVNGVVDCIRYHSHLSTC